MAGWLDMMLDLLWPPGCVGCRTDGSWWCDDCTGQVEPRLIREAAPDLDGILAAAYYGPPLQQGLRALKYRHAKAVAPALAHYLIAPLGSVPTGNRLLVPVPLHPARLKQRGHNQATLLTTGLAVETGDPVSDHLVRTRKTVSQTTLDKPHRTANVNGAFAWRGPSLAGKTAVIIDDVTTTGATLSACAAAVRLANPEAVWGLAVAKKR